MRKYGSVIHVLKTHNYDISNSTSMAHEAQRLQKFNQSD